MRTRVRVAIIAVLFLSLFGLCIHYDATASQQWPSTPDAETIAENPDAYDGETVLLFGTVQSVDADEDRLVMVSQGVLELTVSNFEKDVEPGGVVQVYGELSEESTVQHADRTVVVNADGGAELYKWVASVIGGLLSAGLFLWYWRIDWRELSFEVRNG